MKGEVMESGEDAENGVETERMYGMMGWTLGKSKGKVARCLRYLRTGEASRLEMEGRSKLRWYKYHEGG